MRKSVKVFLFFCFFSLPLYAFEFKDALVLEGTYGWGFLSSGSCQSSYRQKYSMEGGIAVENKFNLWFGPKVIKNTQGNIKGSFNSFNTQSDSISDVEIEQFNLPQCVPQVQYNAGLQLSMGVGFYGTLALYADRSPSSMAFLSVPFSIGFANRLYFSNNTELDINLILRSMVFFSTLSRSTFDVEMGYALLRLEFVRLYSYNNMMMGWSVSLEAGWLALLVSVGYVIQF